MSSATIKLGEWLSSLNRNQEDIKQNISPDDPNETLQNQDVSELVIEGTLVVNAITIPTDGFIMGHPANSVLDDITLPFNKPYPGGKFPLTFPILFTESEKILEKTV